MDEGMPDENFDFHQPTQELLGAFSMSIPLCVLSPNAARGAGYRVEGI